MANQPIPIKGTAFTLVFPLLDNDGDLVTGASGLDSEVSKDKGTFANCTNEATELATSSGMYYLDLTATEMNADLVAVIVKTSTTNAKTTSMVLYPYSTTSGTEVGGTGLDNTLAGLRWMLRVRLNDLTNAGAAGGNYATSHLDMFINLAYRETVRRTKCKKSTNTIALVAATAEYDGTTIFEGLDFTNAAATSTPLKFLKGGEKAMSSIDPDWRAAANGTPTHWWHTRGGYIQLHPAPDATAAAATWKFTGYAIPADMTDDADTPVDLPDGDAVQAILDRAECHARRARPTHANNVALSADLERSWLKWCDEIRDSLKSEGN